MLIIYLLSQATFPIQRQSRVVVTETVWPVKPKTFSMWPFADKVVDLLCIAQTESGGGHLVFKS